ncbi:hypothetical protein WG902_15580 [Ramlibacter sp. PS3R-8]|uniref:hypothetical protein n=1 Tax=Ramlibacter sp. PS3R-8 TaxID=3133437 RepID=UPI0030B30C54
MNRLLLACLAIAGAAAANVSFAGNHGEDWDPLPPFQGSRTRVDVIAEMQQSRATMAASHGEDSGSAYLMATATPGTASRGDVVAEYLRSRDDVAAMNGEDSGSALIASVRARQAERVQLASDTTSAQ